MGNRSPRFNDYTPNTGKLTVGAGKGNKDRITYVIRQGQFVEKSGVSVATNCAKEAVSTSPRLGVVHKWSDVLDVPLMDGDAFKKSTEPKSGG